MTGFATNVSEHLLYGLIVASPEPLPAPVVVSEIHDVEIVESREPLSLEHPPRRSAFGYKRLDDGSAFVEWLTAIQFTISRDGRLVTFFASAQSDRRLVFDFLVAQVMSVALLQRGIETLHATAVEFDGRAIALVGDCGFGKSTLAAACMQAGARLVTDDLLVLDRAPDGFRVLPGAQRIKLTPDVAALTIGERDGVPMDDARGKSIYPLTDAEFSRQPVPLERIVVLRPDSAAQKVEPLTRTAAFHALLQATFNPLDTSPDRLRGHMEFFTRLAATVRVEALAVPWDAGGLGRNAAVVQAMMGDAMM